MSEMDLLEQLGFSRELVAAYNSGTLTDMQVGELRKQAARHYLDIKMIDGRYRLTDSGTMPIEEIHALAESLGLKRFS